MPQIPNLYLSLYTDYTTVVLFASFTLFLLKRQEVLSYLISSGSALCSLRNSIWHKFDQNIRGLCPSDMSKIKKNISRKNQSYVEKFIDESKLIY
jgi:hypothetical protein